MFTNLANKLGHKPGDNAGAPALSIQGKVPGAPGESRRRPEGAAVKFSG